VPAQALARVPLHGGRFGGAEVRCARYATFGTADLAASAVERCRTARLPARQSWMIAVAGTLEVAFSTREAGDACAQYLTAGSRASLCFLSDEEMARCARYGNYGVGFCQ